MSDNQCVLCPRTRAGRVPYAEGGVHDSEVQKQRAEDDEKTWRSVWLYRVNKCQE